MDPLYAATIISFLIFIAGLVSVKIALSAAIIEIVAGVVAGNFLGIHPSEWMNHLAMFGGIVLTFLAGAEVDSDLLREKYKESLLIGGVSFFAPYLASIAFCYWYLGWSLNASLVAGCALSTTSLAVVYAVLVESGLSKTELGKIIMAATFITDMGTAIALSTTFAEWNYKTGLFFVLSTLVIVLAVRFLPGFFRRYGDKVIEPEIKLLFFLLFALMSLARWGQSHAVLVVFILGLVMSRTFLEHSKLQQKLRVVSFAMITPFFFIKGGMNVSLLELSSSLGLFLMLFALKTVTKFVGVYPFAMRYLKGSAMFTTLLMSTGLTFGTISATFGLQSGYITTTQFSVLVSVVIATAIVPTFIAQRWFSVEMSPDLRDELLARGEEAA